MINSSEYIPIEQDDANQYRRNRPKTLSKTTLSNFGKSRTSGCLKTHRSRDQELFKKSLQRICSSVTLPRHKLSKHSVKKKEPQKEELTPLEICDGQINSHIVLTKQMLVDKHTMTTFKDKGRKIDFASIFTKPYRNLQGTDPRLLKKYSLCKQSVQTTRSLPSESRPHSVYGDGEETDEDTELFHTEHEHFMYSWLDSLSRMSVSFIGTLCGILFVSLVIWNMVDAQLIQISFETPPQALFFQRNLGYLLRHISNTVQALHEKLLRLLTITSGEVFAPKRQPRRWYRFY